MATYSNILPQKPHEQYKRQKDMTPNGEPLPDPGWTVSKILLRKSRGQLLIAPENNAQFWMCLVPKVKSDAVKNNIA